MRIVHHHRHDHSVHAKWLGRVCRWVSSDEVLFAASFYLLKQDVARALKQPDVVRVSTERRAA
jgi:hypothetical protein